MSNNDNPSSDDVVSDEEVAFALSLWIPIGCGLLLVYLLVLRPFFPSWFLLRPDAHKIETGLESEEHDHLKSNRETTNRHDSNKKSSSSSSEKRGKCDWFILLFYPVYETLTLSESEWIKRCGLDVYFTIRLLNLCFGCTLILSIFNTVVLVPSYRSQPKPESCDAYCAVAANESAESDAFRAECVCRWIDQSSMAMVPARSDTLWLPAIFMFLTSMLVIGLFAQEYKRVIWIRNAHQDRKPFFSAYVETDLPSSVPGKLSRLIHKRNKTTKNASSAPSNPADSKPSSDFLPGVGGASVRPMGRNQSSSLPSNLPHHDQQHQQQQCATYGSFVRSPGDDLSSQEPYGMAENHQMRMVNEGEEDSQQQHLLNKQREAAAQDRQRMQTHQRDELVGDPSVSAVVDPKASLQFLRARFEELFPGKIHSMHVISWETRNELKTLEKIAKARFKVLVALENAIQELDERKQQHQDSSSFDACRTKMSGFCGSFLPKTRVRPPDTVVASSHAQQQQQQQNSGMDGSSIGRTEVNTSSRLNEQVGKANDYSFGGGHGSKQEQDRRIQDEEEQQANNNIGCFCCCPKKKVMAQLEREVADLEVDLDRLNEEFAHAKREFLYQNSIQLRESDDRSISSSQKVGRQQDLVNQDKQSVSKSTGFWGGRQLAFVTFKNMAWNEIAMDTLLDHNIRVRLAPAANDIRWGALLGRTKSGPMWSVVRTTLARLLFVVILVFWGTITSAIGAITSVESISQIFPNLKESLESNPSIVFYLDRFLALIYIILLSLAFPLVQLSTRLESFRISETELNTAVMGRFLLFLVIQVFIFYSVAGTVFKSVVEIANEPAMIVTTLATTIPKNAAFFLSYMAVQVFNETLDLTRVLGLLLYVLGEIYATFCWCTGKPRTSQVRHRRYHACGCCWHFKFPSSFGLAGRNAEICLIFIIAICYSVIQPLINLSALVYFLFARICFGIQALSTNYQNVEGEGRFWTIVYTGIISGLILAQLTLIGILFVKQGYSPAIFTIVVTLLFTIILAMCVNRMFKKRFLRWSMYDLVQTDEPLDFIEEERGSESDINQYYSKDYLSETPPALLSDRTPPTATVSNSAVGAGETRMAKRRFVEVVPEPIIRYNHMLGHMWKAEGNAGFEEEKEEENDVESGERVLRVNKYVHPVLLEKDFVSPGKSILDIADDQESLCVPLSTSGSNEGKDSARAATPRHASSVNTPSLLHAGLPQSDSLVAKKQDSDQVAIV